MTEERAQRHLAAILAADVVGYSRLMEQNEAHAFARLKAHRKELFEPEIERYQGRVFKLMSDGLLAEFGSVVDAVECAVVLQRAMAERNDRVPTEQRIDLRIGVTLSDVILEERLPLPEPKPGFMPKDMLQGIKARAYRRRGLLPPEDHPDD